MSKPHDPEEDATFIFNTHRSNPYEAQVYIAETTLAYLDSTEASMQYSPGDLIYMRGVWKRVRNKIESKYGPGED